MRINPLYQPTNAEKAKYVMGALGNDIKQYAIRSEINQDEIAQIYGERFRDSRLVYYPGVSEYDDSSYYMAGEMWMVVAKDVTDPGRVVATCLLEEIRNANKNLNSTIHELLDRSANSITLCDYSEVCDDNFLHRNGIVFAYKSDFFGVETLHEIEAYFEPEELGEVENFIS